MKEVELLGKNAHKDFKGLAVWLTRNARHRLGARFSGSGPKLVAALKLDPDGLRPRGGLFTTQWVGVAELRADFTTEQGAPVAKVSAAAEPSPNGQLEPAGDRLLDDLAAFLAAP